MRGEVIVGWAPLILGGSSLLISAICQLFYRWELCSVIGFKIALDLAIYIKELGFSREFKRKLLFRAPKVESFWNCNLIEFKARVAWVVRKVSARPVLDGAMGKDVSGNMILGRLVYCLASLRQVNSVPS